MSQSGSLSPLAAALVAEVAAHRVQKVELAQLRAAQARHDPTGAASSDARVRLAAALRELADGGSVVLPRSPNHFERHLQPSLPLWVKRPSTPRPQRPAMPTRVWRTELATAATIVSTPAEFMVLAAVDEFLRDGGHSRPAVPHRERSWQLFGDEKALDRLLRGRLFSTGALTLELIRAYIAPLPLTATHTGDPGPDPTLLIVENHATYASALTVARERAAVGEVAIAVGYGSGNQLANAIAGVTQLDPVPQRIAYFGDLDPDGLRIPLAAATAARALGLPKIRPAKPLYRAMLGIGRPGLSKSGPLRPLEAEVLTAWLDDDLRSDAVELLTSGRRLAQEAVGYEVLRTLPTWC